MKTHFFRVVVAAALFATLLWTGTAVAAPRKGDQDTSATRIVITNVQPAQVVTVFASDYAFDPLSASDRDPSQDLLVSTSLGAVDGNRIELSVPVGKVGNVWLWDEQRGYRFLGNVSPDDNAAQIVLDASQAK
jgi:hypothetical protein